MSSSGVPSTSALLESGGPSRLGDTRDEIGLPGPAVSARMPYGASFSPDWGFGVRVEAISLAYERPVAPASSRRGQPREEAPLIPLLDPCIDEV